jgi:hypothetical protein
MVIRHAARAFLRVTRLLGGIEAPELELAVAAVLDQLSAAARDNNQVEGTWGASVRIDAIVARHRPKASARA